MPTSIHGESPYMALRAAVKGFFQTMAAGTRIDAYVAWPDLVSLRKYPKMCIFRGTMSDLWGSNFKIQVLRLLLQSVQQLDTELIQLLTPKLRMISLGMGFLCGDHWNKHLT